MDHLDVLSDLSGDVLGLHCLSPGNLDLLDGLPVELSEFDGPVSEGTVGDSEGLGCGTVPDTRLEHDGGGSSDEEDVHVGVQDLPDLLDDVPVELLVLLGPVRDHGFGHRLKRIGLHVYGADGVKHSAQR